jgi:hypothetical protein
MRTAQRRRFLFLPLVEKIALFHVCPYSIGLTRTSYLLVIELRSGTRPLQAVTELTTIDYYRFMTVKAMAT